MTAPTTTTTLKPVAPDLGPREAPGIVSLEKRAQRLRAGRLALKLAAESGLKPSHALKDKP